MTEPEKNPHLGKMLFAELVPVEKSRSREHALCESTDTSNCGNKFNFEDDNSNYLGVMHLNVAGIEAVVPTSLVKRT